MMPLAKIMEQYEPTSFFASEHIRKKRWSVMLPTQEPTIWHENKAGHVSAYPYSCALRANASYNYLWVNGERRLTPRERLRLQGFPESFKIVCSDSQTRKQVGNSLPVNVAQAILREVFHTLNLGTPSVVAKLAQQQLFLFEHLSPHHAKTEIKNGRKIPSSLPS